MRSPAAVVVDEGRVRQRHRGNPLGREGLRLAFLGVRREGQDHDGECGEQNDHAHEALQSA